MSKAGAPTLTVEAGGLRVAVVAASWHATIMDGLLDGARRALADAGVSEVVEVRGPGQLRAARGRRAPGQDGEYDALVALGVVVRGGTPHFDYVCSAATDGLTRVAVENGIPVGFGVLTL